jgi:hypothetical protein
MVHSKKLWHLLLLPPGGTSPLFPTVSYDQSKLSPRDPMASTHAPLSPRSSSHRLVASTSSLSSTSSSRQEHRHEHHHEHRHEHRHEPRSRATSGANSNLPGVKSLTILNPTSGSPITITFDPNEPPPPYRRAENVPAEERLLTEDEEASEGEDVDDASDETAPLLGAEISNRRLRQGSQASGHTTHVHISSPSNSPSPLFLPSSRQHVDSSISRSSHPPQTTTTLPRPKRTFRELVRDYFRPMNSKAHWKSLTYLVLINFPMGLVLWLHCFLGMVLGTTLLVTLPFGVGIWWLTLVGGRGSARLEVNLLPPSTPRFPP